MKAPDGLSRKKSSEQDSDESDSDEYLDSFFGLGAFLDIKDSTKYSRFSFLTALRYDAMSSRDFLGIDHIRSPSDLAVSSSGIVELCPFKSLQAKHIKGRDRIFTNARPYD
jgi:hypothetical protein